VTGALHVEHVMGMAVTIDIRDDRADAAALVEDVVAWLHAVDATFSTYKPGSAISRLGRGELALDDTPDDVRWVLAQCESLRRRTGGFFDACVAGSLDPSGFVKGWAVEVASARLRAGGSLRHCINAGGDVRACGEPAPGRPWLVGIAHPLVAGALCAVIPVRDGAVATSGTAERGAHVFDPHTGKAALDLASVTVAGPDLAQADAFATAALAMGFGAPAWLATLDGYEAYAVDAGGREWATLGWPRLADVLSGAAGGPVGPVGSSRPYQG
jgi:thiamine biosynthesis lipoprotein